MWHPFESKEEKEKRLENKKKRKAVSILYGSLTHVLSDVGLIPKLIDSSASVVYEWGMKGKDFCCFEIKHPYSWDNLEWGLVFHTHSLIEKELVKQIQNLYGGSLKRSVCIISNSEYIIISQYPRKIINDFHQVMEQANRLHLQSEMLRNDLQKRIDKTCTTELKEFVERYY